MALNEEQLAELARRLAAAQCKTRPLAPVIPFPAPPPREPVKAATA